MSIDGPVRPFTELDLIKSYVGGMLSAILPFPDEYYKGAKWALEMVAKRLEEEPIL